MERVPDFRGCDAETASAKLSADKRSREKISVGVSVLLAGVLLTAMCMLSAQRYFLLAPLRVLLLLLLLLLAGNQRRGVEWSLATTSP